MSSHAHPFATGGGGPRFENRVATLLAADMIASRQTEHGGVISAVELQTGPKGFDDLQVSLELPSGSSRTLHAQCRHRQPFTKSNTKFAELVAQADAAIADDEFGFATGHKRLAIIVDHRSPGHDSITTLCELARDPGDLGRFVSVIETHGQAIRDRWKHCLGAACDLEPERVHRLLASLEVRPVEVDSETSRGSVELINRLAELWSPADPVAATNLSNALSALCADLATSAGMVEMGRLHSQLGSLLPSTLGASTRREKLRRRRDAGHLRTVSRLMTVGLDSDEANKLAMQVFAAEPSISITEPITVVSGLMGVGKSTELERLHRTAFDEALEDANAPIPVFVDAVNIGHASLQSELTTHVAGLGDPTGVGVHLVIDGLDEAGVQVSELVLRIASMQAEWRDSTVVLGTRPQESPTGIEAVTVAPLAVEDAQNLMETVERASRSCGGFGANWLRFCVARCSLFASRWTVARTAVSASIWVSWSPPWASMHSVTSATRRKKPSTC